jgi:hypothetical protein
MGGVVVIASGPSCATVTAVDLDARGGRELVINPVGCTTVVIAIDRVAARVGVLIEEALLDGDEGEAFALDNSPRSLCMSDALMASRQDRTYLARATNWAARAQTMNTTATRRKRL